ncbi:hypothetical protein EYC84_003457 [Monilinia fructicola]|uniref:Uncharacterized protein n=1 Tax=Monilinia fructicola TaxID=38448 RepID=A0A5M9JXM3_MONFR|nr:hypothetical protein EYC84_003457 [Monilinia fructicola]
MIPYMTTDCRTGRRMDGISVRASWMEHWNSDGFRGVVRRTGLPSGPLADRMASMPSRTGCRFFGVFSIYGSRMVYMVGCIYDTPSLHIPSHE